MALHEITMDYRFECPPQLLFDRLTDHEGFGRLMGQRIERVTTAPGEHPNGLGAVRRIYILPFLSFDETVTAFEPPSFMQYKVSRGSPIKDHCGELRFTPEAGGTRLHYRICFAPKLPGTGWLLALAIKAPIEKVLKTLQKTVKTQAD